jgi:hypothetical protein
MCEYLAGAKVTDSEEKRATMQKCFGLNRHRVN